MRITSGLDWSGDAGDPKKTPGMSPLLVTAVVHIDVEDWDSLEQALAEARRTRSLPANYVFHFSGSRPKIREAFFDEIKGVPLFAHARLLDKRLWTRSYLQATTGDDRIQAEILELLLQCPDTCIGGQTLLIDGSRREARKIAPLKTALSRALTTRGRDGLRRVKACPDSHPTQGALVQVADMIAGALHDAGNITGPYLSGLGVRITLF